MGQVLQWSLLHPWESVRVEARVINDLVEIGGFQKVTEVGLVRRSWVDGSEERIWKPSLRISLRR